MASLGSSSTAFNVLPMELNQEIARYLESDKDIASLRLVCRSTHYAVDSEIHGLFRERFRERFVVMKHYSGRDIKKLYMSRTKLLRRGAAYPFRGLGHSKYEGKIIHLLQSLVNESYQAKRAPGEVRCRNQEQLITFMLNSQHFLVNIPPYSSKEANGTGHTLMALRVMCTQLLFEFQNMKYDILNFEDCQKMVYAHYMEQPIFLGFGNWQVNMDWLLHCMSFFRHHMVRQEAQSLYEAMADLGDGDQPSAWRTPLQNGAYPLHRFWKGTYSFLDPRELDQIRYRRWGADSNLNTFFVDKNIELGGGQLQELELNFIQPEDSNYVWPQALEDRLQSFRETMTPRSRSQHLASNTDASSMIHFTGNGVDVTDKFSTTGWLNALEPQHGIPGWQRITMMKHFQKDLNNWQEDDLWAYEGVVLPGGRMIFGRWWLANMSPEDRLYASYSGPFILWACDSAPTVIVDSGNENSQ